jgi:hypothetical protein
MVGMVGEIYQGVLGTVPPPWFEEAAIVFNKSFNGSIRESRLLSGFLCVSRLSADILGRRAR